MFRREIFLPTILCFVGLVFILVVSSLGARQERSEQLTIEAVRRVLAQPQKRQTIGGIPLAGFEFSREIEIGSGRRVVAISCTRNGGLVAFDTRGKAIASVQTGEITSLEIFDLTEDSTSEVVVDEVDGSGTGVLSKAFVVYRITDSDMRQIWKGESLFRSAPWNPMGKIHTSQKTCFLRFDPSGGGQPATITHICSSTDGHFAQKTYEWRQNSVQERKKSSAEEN